MTFRYAWGNADNEELKRNSNGSNAAAIARLRNKGGLNAPLTPSAAREVELKQRESWEPRRTGTAHSPRPPVPAETATTKSVTNPETTANTAPAETASQVP
jgi:hypothetical protein